MKTFNNFSEMVVAKPPQTTVRTTPSAITNVEPGDKDRIAELLAPTMKDIIQFKGVVHLCSDFTPVAKFAIEDDVLRLKQVTLVKPDNVELVGKHLNDD